MNWLPRKLMILFLAIFLSGCGAMSQDYQLSQQDQEIAKPTRTSNRVQFISWDYNELALESSPDSPDTTPDQKASALEANQGCLSQNCHQDMLPGSLDEVHPPFAQIDCQTCHTLSPDHTVGSSPHVDNTADIDICYTCHPVSALEISRPVGGDNLDPITSGLLTCTSTCHNPHSSKYNHLLRSPGKDQLCLMCHQF